jgi:hypothetical protein
VIRLVEDAGVGNHNLDGHRAENLQQVGHVCGLHILMIFAIWDRPSAATCQCVVTKPHIDVKNKVIFSNRGFFRLNSRVRVRFRRHRLHAFFFITTSTQNHQKGVRCGTRWNICYEGKMLIMSPSQTQVRSEHGSLIFSLQSDVVELHQDLDSWLADVSCSQSRVFGKIK